MAEVRAARRGHTRGPGAQAPAPGGSRATGGDAARGRGEQSAAMTAAIDGMAVLDGRGRFREINRALAGIYGLADGRELVGRSWQTLYAPEQRARLKGEAARALSKDGEWRGEATGRRADGTPFPQALSLAHTPDGGLVCVVRDVTERMRLEADVRASQERFRTVLGALGEGIVINDAADRAVYCNPRFAEMTGYSPEDVIGRRPEDFTFPEDRAYVQDIRSQRASGLGSEYEIRQRRADGSEMWVGVNGRPFYDAEGEIAGSVAVMTDITERRHTREELCRRSEHIERQSQYLRAVIDASPTLIFAKDREGRFTLANRALATAYGTTPDELIGKSDADFNPDQAAVELYLAADREVIDTGRSVLIAEESITTVATGETRWLQTRKVRLLPPDGGAPHVVVLSIDITDRLTARNALEHSERQLAEAQRLARMGSWEYDLRTGVAAWSAEGYRIFGVPGGEPITYARFLEAVHPDDREHVQREHDGAAGRGGSAEYDFRIIRPDGETRYLTASVQTDLDAGQPVRTFGYVQDVTGRRLAELELRRSEQQLATTQSMARLGSWWQDFRTGTGAWSEEGCRILGVEPGSHLSNDAFMGMVHPDDRAWLAGNTARAIASGEQCDGEFRVRHSSGEYRYLWSSAQVEYAEGTPVRMFGHLQDITERRLAELELLRSRHQLAETQHMAALGSWEYDLTTGSRTWSGDGHRIFGIDPEAGILSDEGFFALVHPDDVGLLVETNATALQQRDMLHASFRVTTPQGEERHIDSSVQAEYDASGEPVRLIGYVQDVTAQKRVEMALRTAMETAEAANRAKSEFLSSMSHELRTPLNSVIGFANVLLHNRGGRLADQELTYLGRIQANGKHLLGLINDILDLSKIEAGKLEIELRPVSLGELVAETVAELAGTVRGKDVALHAVVPEGLAAILTDPLKLKQVLINLVGNAAKFTEQGSITVSVIPSRDGSSPLRLEVRDTGVGIPPDRLTAIFQAFEQADSGTARRFGGTGLGLTISRSLCMLMGHRLEVASEPGVGSTFSVLLAAEQEYAPGPADERADDRAHPQPEVQNDPDFRGRTVLVIDDEADARTLLTHDLEELGCRAVHASSGSRGLRLARELRPDLITLDLLMPGVNGWEILRALKADPGLEDIPVVIVSVLATEARASLRGAVDLIEKPFELAQLRRVLGRHLPAESRKVLLVHEHPQAVPGMTRWLEDEGHEIRSAVSGAEALRLLDEGPAHLIVLDLPARADGVALLHQLRNTPGHGHVPVLIVAPREAPPIPEGLALGRLAEAVLPRGATLDALLAATAESRWRSAAPPLPPFSAGPARSST